MIEISKRELYELEMIMDELEQGYEFSLTTEMGGHDLSRIQNSLIADIIGEYISKAEEIKGK